MFHCRMVEYFSDNGGIFQCCDGMFVAVECFSVVSG